MLLNVCQLGLNIKDSKPKTAANIHLRHIFPESRDTKRQRISDSEIRIVVVGFSCKVGSVCLAFVCFPPKERYVCMELVCIHITKRESARLHMPHSAALLRYCILAPHIRNVRERTRRQRFAGARTLASNKRA